MKLLFTALLTCLIAASPAMADDTPTYTITFKDGSFEPKALDIPADTRVKLEIVNAEDKPIEFESNDMKAEKIIRSGKTRSIKVGPLAAGTYTYFNEFNTAAGEGVVTVK